MQKKKILFICTGNAGRSQMAEAMFRKLYEDKFEVLSAGVEPWDDLHPMAVKLMHEDGLSMAGHYPKHVKEFVNDKIDIAVTIGDRAEAESGCFRTGTLRIHWPINDPADADGTPDSEKVFRWTRQAIIDRFPKLLKMAESLRNNQDNIWQPGISTCAFHPPDDNWTDAAFLPPKHLPMLKKAGFETIELCCYVGDYGELDFPWQSPDKVKELAEIALDCDISIKSVHVPELRLSGLGKADSKKVDILKRFIEICLKLNSRLMVVHYFPEKNEDYDQEIPEILLELDALVCDKPLLIGLETLQQRELNRKLISLFDHLNPSSFGSVIDTGHCNIAGDLYDISHALGKSIKSLHLHDNDSRKDQHLSIGKGVIDWHRFFNSLIDVGYEGPLMLESDERPSARELYSSLAKSRKSLDRLYR
jgi:arsenate reductase (thioredoxin)